MQQLNFETELKKKQIDFSNLVTQKKEELTSFVKPFTESSQNIAVNLIEDFGNITIKLLYPINTHPVKIGNIITSKAFYMERSTGKKKQVLSSSLFHCFSERFVSGIKDPTKKQIAKDLLQFRDAVLKSFGPFQNIQAHSVSNEIEYVSTKRVIVSDGIENEENEKDNEKGYLFINSPIYKTANIKLYLVFTELAKDENRQISPQINTTFPRISIIVTSNPTSNKHIFWGNVNINLGNTPLNPVNSIFDLLFPGVDINRGVINHTMEIKYNNDGNLFQLQLHTWDENRIIAHVDCGYNMQLRNFIKYKLNKFALGKNQSVSTDLLLNWTQLLQTPSVVEEINKYIANWQLITKTWNYIKTKYAYRLMMTGDF